MFLERALTCLTLALLQNITLNGQKNLRQKESAYLQDFTVCILQPHDGEISESSGEWQNFSNIYIIIS